MKPQHIIVGTFGLQRATRIACERQGAVILDCKSRFVLRSLESLIGIYLTPTRFRILLLLSMVARVATRLNIEDVLWGECEDGGPMHTRQNLNLYIHHLRRNLAPLGLWIKTDWGMGVELCDAESRI